MNTQPGIFGRKLGCTQIFEPDGTVTRVTVIEAGPVVVIGKRTEEKDGYIALVLGLERAQGEAHDQAARGLLQEGRTRRRSASSRSSAASEEFAAQVRGRRRR